MSQGTPRGERLMKPFRDSYFGGGGRKLPSNVKVDHGYWCPYNLLYNAADKLPDGDAELLVKGFADNYDAQALAFGAEFASRMTADRIIAEHVAKTLGVRAAAKETGT